MDQLFKIVAWRRGPHWNLAEGERNELGVALARVAKTLPAIPEEKLGKYSVYVGAAMVVVGIVQPRLEADERIKERRPIGAPAPTVERVSPADAERLVAEAAARGEQVRFMTPEEYEAYIRTGGADEWPTVAATDPTLLDRVIEQTAGIDQGTLATEARNSGRIGGEE
jgi:hypothetical protein